MASAAGQDVHADTPGFHFAVLSFQYQFSTNVNHVSDSGTLPEESSFYLSIGHPIAAVCIRTSTERPEALEAGDFILAGITTRELLNATDMAIEMKQKGVLGKPCPDYVDETVSMKVVRIIQGYVNVVNKMVWRKG